MSAKIGVISCHWSACAVAMNVYDGTITSPFRSSARVAISSAIVPLHMATQCLTFRNSAIRRSNSWATGPVVREPPAVQDLGGALQEPRVIADVRAADVQRLREQRRRAADRKIVDGPDRFLGLHAC